MKTKLIIVEGLPGFGKTTTAGIIHEKVTEQSKKAELFLEGNLDHPADYDGVAYFNQEEFNRLISISGEAKELIEQSVIEKSNEFFVPYQKIKNEHFSDELLSYLYEHDIYELPFEQHVELLTKRWEEFAEKAHRDDTVYIFECCFIQNPVTIGMIKYGVSDEKVIDYVNKLAAIIEKLNPVLFYVDQDNLEFSFKKAIKERPEAWSTGFIEYYTNQEYGRQHGLHGVDGTIKVLEARRQLERKIVEQLKITKEQINNSLYEKEQYTAMICEKLKRYIG